MELSMLIKTSASIFSPHIGRVISNVLALFCNFACYLCCFLNSDYVLPFHFTVAVAGSCLS